MTRAWATRSARSAPGRRRFGAGASAFAILLFVAALSPTLAVASVPGGGRGWELVTPAEPMAAQVYDATFIDPEGTKVLFRTIGPLPGALGGLSIPSNLATRSEQGWSMQPVDFTYSNPTFNFATLVTAFAVAFNLDFSASIWVGAVPLTPDAPQVEEVIALYRLTEEGLEFLTEAESESFIAASEDVQHVIFSAALHLLPEDSLRTSGESIYEADGKTLHLVDVDSEGSIVSPCGSAVSPFGGVSRSGERIFFTAPPPSSSCTQPSKVYLREGGATTIPVSASQCARVDCNVSQAVQFAGATPDGSVVYLTTSQQLTNADVDQERDLYAFDVAASTMRLLSEAEPGQNGETISGRVYPSVDGSGAYFFANGRLLAGLGREAGQNLYLADLAGVHFVAPIGSTDSPQVAESGRVAVFATTASLEAADADGRRDVYLYEAEGEHVTRISAGSGGNGPFDARITTPIVPIELGPDSNERAISADGSQAFFSTSEQLLPEDENAGLDVYEWGDGGLDLISSGSGSADAEFGGASANGATVLFKTTQSLVPQDNDGGDRDLYAARAGGGFPAQEGPACVEPSCPTSPSPRLARGTTPSERVPAGPRRRAPRLKWRGGELGRSLVGRGFGDLRVRVSGPGLLTARAQSVYSGKPRTALWGAAGAVRAGTVTLRLHAAAWARRALRLGHALHVHLTLRQAAATIERDETVPGTVGR
jgi:hypothetical protein